MFFFVNKILCYWCHLKFDSSIFGKYTGINAKTRYISRYVSSFGTGSFGINTNPYFKDYLICDIFICSSHIPMTHTLKPLSYFSVISGVQLVKLGLA